MISSDRRIISVLPSVKLVQEGLLGCSSYWQVKLDEGSIAHTGNLSVIAKRRFVHEKVLSLRCGCESPLGFAVPNNNFPFLSLHFVMAPSNL
jgi:hypothetical protein